MKTVKRFCIFILVINMLFLNGCWNYTEIESLSQVSGMAIDKGKKGQKYHLTFELLDMKGESASSKLLETDGDTIFDAIRNAVGKCEKKLTFSQCKIVVINKEIAAEGISPILDFLNRDNEPRITLIPVISNEKTAGEIFQQQPMTDKIHGFEIWKMLTQNSKYLSKTYSVSLYEANNMLAEDGSSLALPTVKTSQEKTKIVELDGTAVFKSDKLIGFLDNDQTKFLLFIKNRVNGGLLLTNPDSKKNDIALEILNSKTKITPVVKNNVPMINLNIKLEAALGEDQSIMDYTSPKGLAELEQSAKKTLEKGVSDLIKDVQTNSKSDIFGFGNSFYKNNPKWWKDAKSNWEQIFPKLKVNVTADVKIENTAMLKSKIKVGD